MIQKISDAEKRKFIELGSYLFENINLYLSKDLSKVVIANMIFVSGQEFFTLFQLYTKNLNS